MSVKRGGLGSGREAEVSMVESSEGLKDLSGE